MYLRCGRTSNAYLFKAVQYTSLTAAQRKYQSIAARRRKLLQPTTNVAHVQQIRRLGILFRVVRGVAKLRYIVLGSAITGGYQIKKKYEDWRDALPDVQWIKDLFSDEQLQSWQTSVSKLKDLYPSDAEWMKKLSADVGEKIVLFNQWIEEAKEAQKLQQQELLFIAEEIKEVEPASADKGLKTTFTNFFQTSDERVQQQEQKYNKLQDELLHTQLKYQKEIERLERENKELRRQVLLKAGKSEPKRKIKKSLIDLYSDVLDELSDYDHSYNTQDHLPRVIVVGDQSAGKTSVLEMIAGARIFPRGAGEMMTRAPVKVTLSEGPYHVARFKDSAREFDLTKESELAELRREVEIRMRNSVRSGKTVSNEVISMTVQGPGLQRVVLVDLPGVISTVTTEMAEDTRDAIKEMTKTYMSNPNAIILCIQDGSVDAERSIVTDLVSQMDPCGKRTIFVLTKVDLAEQNMADPTRLRKILDGKLFPMKALGYFAVVTGKDGKDTSISAIKKWEDDFFRNSKLCKQGILNLTQCTTKNLSLAVSECFWKMVKASVEQQADAFKATRYNLETEWKNSFSHVRELDRDELFEKARSEILDEIINLSHLPAKYWEEVLTKKLWDRVALHIFEQIYLPAAQSANSGSFRTQVDIRLRQWAELTLPEKAVGVGWESLKDEFNNLIQKPKAANHDKIFDALKVAVSEEAMKRHAWEPKAAENLRVIQLNALEDYSVPDKQQWDAALRFLETSVEERLRSAEALLREMVGPGFFDRWYRWSYQTSDQKIRSAIKSELQKLFSNSGKFHEPTIANDELTAVRKNLQAQDIDVDGEMIKQVWYPLYRISFLKESLNRANDCRKGFYLYHQGHGDELNCDDVVLFWRIKRMLEATSNSLRQQVMNREARRLEKEIKEVLDDFSQDQEKKVNLLTGRRVELAEELKRVRHIQEKLEEFIAALNSEK